MKLFTRLMVGGLALALVLSLGAGTANAAAKKKKKAVKVETKTVRKAKKEYISGTNLEGRAGLFYADTSEVAAKNTVEGSVHFTYSSPGPSVDQIMIPVGAHFGVDNNFELSACVKPWIISEPSVTIGSITIGGSSTNFLLDVGGKYKIASENRETPDFAVGGVIYIPTWSGGNVVVMPEGTCSYVLDNGLLLNGDVGIGIGNTSYVKLDGGVGFPVSPKVTLIGEIGANQDGYMGSVFAAGARFALQDVKLQALIGAPLNGGDVLIGAGLILASK